MVKTSPSNAGDVGLIPGQGAKIPHVAEQLSLHATARSPCATTTEAHQRHTSKAIFKVTMSSVSL